MQKVTPWEARGTIDYDRLIKEFGTKRIDDALLKKLASQGKLPSMLHRKFFFSHRDLNLILNDYQSGKGFFLYTGRAPSGPMHLGHLLPFYITKWFQDTFNVNLYVQIPDEEKFLVKNKLSLKEVDKWTQDNILDIIAVGFNPEKTFIFQNREYAKHMYTLACKIAKKITFSTAKAVFGFTNNTNIGLIFYPAMQAVPAFFEKRRCLIPSAIDQDPYWRIQRDIAESLGYSKTAAIDSKFFPSLTGQGKMAASEQASAVYLNDSPDVVHKKIMKYAFSGGQPTIAEHRKKGGNPDVDVAYQWLDIFFESNDKKIRQIHDDYRSGKLLTGELKTTLIEKINAFLKAHQQQKQKAIKLIGKFKYDGKLAKQMWQKDFK